jgi:mannosyl-3-phosphoglycerate phosphatase
MNSKISTLIVFTDLDGTLLNAADYDFRPALPALHRLQKLKIPVIPCTSKTAAEVIHLRRRMDLHDPFIVENGSAVVFPEDFPHPFIRQLPILGEYRLLVLGRTYQDILAMLGQIKEEFQLPVHGFNDMNVDEIAQHTGLGPAEAELAGLRLFSEPFLCPDPRIISPAVLDFFTGNGFRLLIGNRFYHLLGDTDKGIAVQQTLRLLSQRTENILRSIGLGDGANDTEMLIAVDEPVIVRRSPEMQFQLKQRPDVYYTRAVGAAGWQEAIDLKLLSIQEQD